MDTWRTAHFKQARSDIAVFESIDGHPICQRLHYLQMATEKLGKGYLCAVGERPRRAHRAFVRFLQVCRTDQALSNACNMSLRQFRAHIDSLPALARQIEDLAPAGSVDKPNPEYPWQENGKIVAPVDYPFTQYQLHQTKMVRLLQLVKVSSALS